MKLLSILVIAALLIGCAHNRKSTGSKQQEASAAGGFAKVYVGIQGVRNATTHLRNTPLSDSQAGYVGEVESGAQVIFDGTGEAKKSCDAAIKAADSSRQPFYHLLDIGSFIGGVALAVGMALIVMGFVNGTKIGAGVGVAVLGASGVLTFLTIRSAAPVLPWVMAGVGAISLAGFGYIVWERIRTRRKMIDTKAALVQVVDTVDELKADPKVPNAAIDKAADKTQLPETVKIVRAIKAAKKIKAASVVAADKVSADEAESVPPP